MDASDRLAALLAGDLDADERDALEADLARDPALRASLEAMRRADEGLRTLRSPAPSEGFDQRLDAAIGATLRELLDDDPVAGNDDRTGSRATVVSEDAFTARRRTRDAGRMRTWAGIAAGAVVLAGSGVALTQLIDIGSGDDSAPASVAMDADDAGEESFSLEMEAADDFADAERSGLDGPVVVAEDRVLTDDDLDALLVTGELDAVRAGDLDRADGSAVAERFRATFGLGGPAQTDDAADDAGVAADAGADDGPDADDADVMESDDEPLTGSAPPTTPELVTRDGMLLPPADAAHVARCLDDLLTDAPDAIPVYAELATYEDREVVVFGLVTVDPDTEAFGRSEVWVLDRDTCQVLRFSQG